MKLKLSKLRVLETWVSNNSKDLFIDRKSRDKLLSKILMKLKYG